VGGSSFRSKKGIAAKKKRNDHAEKNHGLSIKPTARNFSAGVREKRVQNEKKEKKAKSLKQRTGGKMKRPRIISGVGQFVHPHSRVNPSIMNLEIPRGEGMDFQARDARTSLSAARS